MTSDEADYGDTVSAGWHGGAGLVYGPLAATQGLIDNAAAVEPLLAEWRPAAVFLRGPVPGQPKRRSAARAKASR